MTSSSVAERTHRRGWALREPLLIFVAARVLIEGVGALVVATRGVPAHSRSGFFGIYLNWDSGFYRCIVSNGYTGPGCQTSGYDGRMAFFPGYPVLARALAWVLGWGDVSSATDAALWLIPFVASAAAAVVLYAVVLRDSGVAVARGAVALLLLGPYACFLVASYAEALFLALALGAWWAASRNRWLLAGLLGAGASFTRVNGLFLGVALIVMYITGQISAGRRIRFVPLLQVALSFGGALAYFLWLGVLTGHVTSWFDAQRDLWKRKFQWPWMTLYRQGGQILHSKGFEYRAQDVIEAGYAVLLVIILVVMIRRRLWPAATYTILTMASLMTSSDYQSLARNALLIFPVFMVVASFLQVPGKRWIFWVAVTGGILLLGFNSIQFSSGRWAD